LKAKFRFGLVLLPVFLAAAPCAGQALRGYTLTDLYAFEDTAETHLQVYQWLFFRLEPEAVRGVSLVAHMRYQGDSADDFSDSSAFRLQNLYLRWAGTPHLDLRLGRQFLFEGVGVGTYDVLRVNYRPRWGGLTLWGGLVPPAQRQAELRDIEANPAFGAAVRGAVRGVNLLGSYLREERDGDLYRHRAGLTAGYRLRDNLTGQARVQANLSGPEALHRASLQVRYGPATDVRLLGEFTIGTPWVPPDSPFEDIEFKTFQLVRASGAYQILPGYWLGLRAHTYLTQEVNATAGLFLEGPWGVVGYRQRFGDFGEENGAFGAASYRLARFAEAYFSADYSSYTFEDQEDREDQAAAQVGLRLVPVAPLLVDASLQGLNNPRYDSDIRGLLRVKWSF